MKKATLLSLLAGLAISLPVGANAACGVTGSDGSAQKECTDSEISNLRRPATIQASDGVRVAAENHGSSDVQVAGAHENGTSSFHGSTEGGSITEYTGYSSDNWSSSADYATLTSGS